MPDKNWKPIDQAPKGIGPLLLRDGIGQLDPVYVGQQADDGRWLFEGMETHPIAWCLIPDIDIEGASA